MCYTWKGKYLPISLVSTTLLLHGGSRSPETTGMTFIPGYLYEMWDEGESAGEKHSRTLLFFSCLEEE